MAKHLVQILLPLRDNSGTPIDRRHFEDVRATLVERFGGLTAYRQAPATGLWKDDTGTGETVEDTIVVYEVLVNVLDTGWWSQYREELARRFAQKDLMVRAHQVDLL